MPACVRQELERLETLTGSADFMPLLEEYAKDLADPKARSRCNEPAQLLPPHSMQARPDQPPGRPRRLLSWFLNTPHADLTGGKRRMPPNFTRTPVRPCVTAATRGRRWRRTRPTCASWRSSRAAAARRAARWPRRARALWSRRAAPAAPRPSSTSARASRCGGAAPPPPLEPVQHKRAGQGTKSNGRRGAGRGASHPGRRMACAAGHAAEEPRRDGRRRPALRRLGPGRAPGRVRAGRGQRRQEGAPRVSPSHL